MQPKIIKTLPKHVGVGFCSKDKIDINHKYKYQQCGIWHNYIFTNHDYRWPIEVNNNHNYTIDGFSPNLNKKLHIGHLRNLVLASSLQKIVKGNFIAWLGGSLGINDDALSQFKQWCKIAQYDPKIYIDIEYAATHKPIDNFVAGKDDQAGCELWNGIIVKRSNGVPTYAYYDLILKDWLKPDYYITGSEQKEHFASLKLSDKHLAMGLVLGEDNKKIKSRCGDAFLAEDAINDVKTKLKPTLEPDKLAWNIIAWNFLRVSREKHTQFLPNQWCSDLSGGMTISYTYARINKALTKCYEVSAEDLSELDVKILGFSEYLKHYINLAIYKMDPSPIADYGFELANELAHAYHVERIKNGRIGFRFALTKALESLENAMTMLSMYKLDSI